MKCFILNTTFTTNYLNSIIGVIIILLILSLVTERFVELIRKFIKVPEKINRFGWLKYINSPSYSGNGINANKKKEVSLLAVLVGIAVAIITRASLFDLLFFDNPQLKLFWPEGLKLEKPVYQFIIGIVFTGFLLGFGSRFFHDLLDNLYYAKEKRRRILNPLSDYKNKVSNTYKFLETDSLQLAKKALTLHEKEIIRKYSGLIENLEIGNTVNNRIGIIAYLKKLPPFDFPRTVPVKHDNGITAHIEIEFVVSEIAKAQFGIEFRLQNPANFGITGALGGIVVSSAESDSRLLLTCSHTALSGSSENLGGYAADHDFGIDIQILESDQEIATGKLLYAKLDVKSDTAIIKPDDQVVHPWNNELPDGKMLGPVTSVFDLKLDAKVIFYSSLKGRFVEGTIHNRRSLNEIFLEYGDLRVKSFSDLIVVGNNLGGFWSTISDKGDSGSILFDENYRPFGLIIGGGNQFTYAVPLTHILEETNTQIYFP